MKQICWLDVVFFVDANEKKTDFSCTAKTNAKTMTENDWKSGFIKYIIKYMRFSEFIKLNGKYYNIKTLCHKLYFFSRTRFHFELPKWKFVYFLLFIVSFLSFRRKNVIYCYFQYVVRVFYEKKSQLYYYCYFMCSFFLLSVSFSILALFSSYR